MKFKSSEGQCLTGYKLIVYGVLNKSVEYVESNKRKFIYFVVYSIRFTTFIVLPENNCMNDNIEVEGIVEDIYYKKVDDRTVFTSAMMLVKANIKC